jgi:membrane protein required for colicin V production
MIIDVFFFLILVSAAVKGFSKGMIMAAFSFAGFFIGLAAALKLSAIVAEYLRESFNDAVWWPVIAFVLVLLVVAALVRAAAAVLEKTLDIAMLGWVNKLAGFLIYAIMYTLLFSVALFYYDQLWHISEETREQSRVYAYIEPWGEWTMRALGRLIPQFRDVFREIQEFFEGVGNDWKNSAYMGSIR